MRRFAKNASVTLIGCPRLRWIFTCGNSMRPRPRRIRMLTKTGQLWTVDGEENNHKRYAQKLTEQREDKSTGRKNDARFDPLSGFRISRPHFWSRSRMGGAATAAAKSSTLHAGSDAQISTWNTVDPGVMAICIQKKQEHVSTKKNWTMAV
jgi:hypothetical protein